MITGGMVGIVEDAFLSENSLRVTSRACTHIRIRREQERYEGKKYLEDSAKRTRRAARVMSAEPTASETWLALTKHFARMSTKILWVT